MIKTLERYRKINSLGGWRDLPATAQRPGRARSIGIEPAHLAPQAEGDLPGGTAK